MLRTSQRRRSSSSTASVNGNAIYAASRRSSITLKDLEYIQSVINKARTTPVQVIFLSLLVAPVLIHSYHSIIYKYRGNIWMVNHNSWQNFLPEVYHPLPWIFVFGTVLLQFLLFWLLPAQERCFRNNVGQLIQQRWNAFSACLLQMLFYSLSACLGVYRADVLVERWDGVMFAGLVLCLLVQVYLCCFVESAGASAEDETSSNTLLHSFCFGRHLQPAVFDMDVKSFVTNRVMCSLWACYLIGAFARQRYMFDKTTSTFVCIALLQFVYLFRRLWSDNCVSETLDNQTYRAGFYRLWGVLVFLPTLYITPVTLACQMDVAPSAVLCVLFFVLGLIAQLITTTIDGQKADFRRRNGQIKINDRDPFYIVAKYRRETGECASNLLLGSGYWGAARHLNYTFEFLSFLAWTLPLRLDFVVGYFPVAFLAALLLNRMFRDELRCLLKYHQNWIQYTNRVPYQLIPHVY